ncbi:phage tail fiber protein [Cupriavidus nantongensis]|uniref:Uncharacterized protein n=1 Tax=Cupriavidus nantongensis TaxID=1796606 RepID=A0A142JMZ4_9BURK|nr:phage tail fiber protein [Cupriavidus nantongensis]AMR79456.1 hypothetical protein A2G96_17860 [Cupriavidus nantongensis]
MLSVYVTDGTRTDYTIDWPYLERSNIVVTANEAPRAFTFVDDHTVRVVTIFGEPLPAGQTLKIMRVTPDLVDYAKFVDAANLTADDLNRARLQCLFLIQERSGGITGSIGTVIQLIQNEIETVSGALDSIAQSQAILTSGLQTLDDLSSQIEVIGNEADALHQQILKEIEDRDAATTVLAQRLDKVEIDSQNLRASVTSEVNLLKSETAALASKTDTIQASLDRLEPGDEEDDKIAASIINTAVTSVKQDSALAKRVETLQATINEDITAQIQTEQTARVSADEALAQQITSLQSQIGEDLAQVIEDMQTSITAVDGKVTGLNAQYTLKAQVQRADGKAVMAAIGLAATSNDDMSGSEIVMMANRLVFADPASVDGPLKPLFTAGNVDGSPTFIIPANVMGDRTYPGRLLVDGSVEARSIKANEITGDKIKAGTLTAREVNVNFGGNIVPNASMVDVNGGLPNGWGTWNGIPGASVSFGDSDGGGVSVWFPNGTKGLFIRQLGPTGNIGAQQYALFSSTVFSVQEGTDYEYSVYSGAHRCTALVMLEYFTAAGASLAISPLDKVAYPDLFNPAQFGGGQNMALFKRIGGIHRAPAGACSARLHVGKYDTYAGNADSWGFFMKPMVAEASPGQTRLTPYKESGLGTKITPGGITTPSLSALSANIGLLRTATSGQRSELDSNSYRVYDGNNVMRVRLGIW